MAAEILGERQDEEMNMLLTRTSEGIAWGSLNLLAGDAIDLERLHTLLRAAAENLDFDGLRRVCLQSWMQALAWHAIQNIQDPAGLEAWATAIGLRFPGRFGDEISRVRDVKRYHESGRNPAALARLEPDLARTLKIIFPPRDRIPPKKKRKPSERRKR